MSKIRVLTVFGTRPEAIKMAPLVKEFEKQPDVFKSIVCVTAQHRQMLDQVLKLFQIFPDFDLNIMKPNQDLWSITTEVLMLMKDVFEQSKPDIVLVHGDTTTSMAAALSAFYARIPVGHVEAGLRTFNKFYPFPEEINRVFADALSSYHFAPTQTSCDNLVKSSISAQHIYKTGNTVIDALLHTVENNKADLSYIGLNPELKTILLTSHRRENFGEPIRNICRAVLELVEKNKDIQVVYPVHLNPNVQQPVNELLGGEKDSNGDPKYYSNYVVGTSGTIVKPGKYVKDSDDGYYAVADDGENLDGVKGDKGAVAYFEDDEFARDKAKDFADCGTFGNTTTDEDGDEEYNSVCE